jgi:AcrR family transcriptional regulator
MKSERKEKRPKAYHHGDLRRTLIEAGLEVLEQSGVAALELREVARRAGVSHAAPYRHFANKGAFLAALIEVGFYRLAEQIEEAVGSVFNKPEVRLQKLASAYVHFAQANPWLMREMFSGLTIKKESSLGVHDATQAVSKLFITIVEEGQSKGLVRSGNSGELASVIWALLHGMSILIIENQTQSYTSKAAGVERMIRTCTQVLYEGLSHR